MFHFKKFSIDDSKCAMKVGTDAVLLGAWSAVKGEGAILDIGTGCGILALMLAQKTGHNKITALEIDTEAAQNASENILVSPWKERIEVVNNELGNFGKQTSVKYVHIISNPPFFQNDLPAADTRKSLAKHSVSLSYEKLVFWAAYLLGTGGTFDVIIPAGHASVFLQFCELNGLFLSHTLTVFGNPKVQAKRVLLRFIKQATKPVEVAEDILYIRDLHGNYTTAYQILVKDYLLHF